MKKYSLAVNVKRLIVYCLGMLVMAFGVSFAKLADLGMSPVNSLPYVLSEIFTFLTMGNFVIVVYCAFILVQFILDGRKIQWMRLLQLPCTVLFGFYTDFTNWLVPLLMPGPEVLAASPVMAYGIRVLYLVISLLVLPMGILLYLAPSLPPLPGEGLSLAISEKVGKPLHVAKTFVDGSLALTSLIVSLLYFRGFHGVREGTIVAALGYGRILGLYSPIKNRVNHFIYGNEEETV